VALWLAVALPQLEARYDDRVVRGRVAATLVAVAPLQMAVDDSRRRHVDLPAPADAAALAPTSPGATWLESVTLGLGNGRLRLVFADALAPLAGKTLLLAPAVDDEQQLQWVCVRSTFRGGCCRASAASATAPRLPARPRRPRHRDPRFTARAARRERPFPRSGTLFA
jgi:hypothetical protein